MEKRPAANVYHHTHTPKRFQLLQHTKRITTKLNTKVILTLRNDSSCFCDVHVVFS